MGQEKLTEIAMNSEADNYQQVLEKPVLVVGANGFVGSHVTRQLVAAQRKVRVLVRKTSNTTAIDDLNVERHYGDVMDTESLKAAMQDCGSLFYCVVDTRAWLTDPAPLIRCNVDGLINAMDAALAQSIGRFVFTSTMGTIGIDKQNPVSEKDAFNWWDKAPPYIRSRVLAENKLLEYCYDKCLPAVAMCVANTYGPMDTQPTPHGGSLWHAATGKQGIALDCAAPTVDIRDAAQALLLAEQYGRAGERYIIANEFVSQADMYTLGANALGRKPPKTLNMSVARGIAAVSEVVNTLMRRKDYKLCRASVLLSEVFGPMDNTKAQQELGWQPRPFAETVTDAIDWFVADRLARKASSTHGK